MLEHSITQGTQSHILDISWLLSPWKTCCSIQALICLLCPGQSEGQHLALSPAYRSIQTAGFSSHAKCYLSSTLLHQKMEDEK